APVSIRLFWKAPCLFSVQTADKLGRHGPHASDTFLEREQHGSARQNFGPTEIDLLKIQGILFLCLFIRDLIVDVVHESCKFARWPHCKFGLSHTRGASGRLRGSTFYCRRRGRLNYQSETGRRREARLGIYRGQMHTEDSDAGAAVSITRRLARHGKPNVKKSSL